MNFSTYSVLLVLLSADGSGEKYIEFPAIANAGTLAVIPKTFMTNFKLTDTPISLDLIEGYYNIWITGGRSATLPDSFHINILSETNGANVPVYEHRLKVRDFNGINFFRLRIPTNDKYKISIENYRDIIVKKTMLPISKLFFPKVDLEKIGLRFQKK